MKNKLVNYKFFKNESITKSSRDIEIVYCLEGKINIKVDGLEYILNNDDVIVINSMKNYVISDVNQAIYVILTIDYYELRKLINDTNKIFVCNSIIEDNENYADLKNIIKKILNCHFDDSEYRNMYYLRYSSDLVIYLLNNFANTAISFSDDDKRMIEITDYIESNYKYSIKLEEVANSLYLSPQYFAKYFKEKTGTTFLKYLNNVRLNHALNDLNNPKNTITKVALDNGFPNITSFTKVFYEKYNINPTKYRKKLENRDANSKMEIADYEIKKSLVNINNEKQVVFDKEINIDPNQLLEYNRYWAKVVNFGLTKDLLNEKICNQLKLLKEELKFENARVIINFEDTEFYELQNALDFLMELRIGIWLVLDLNNHYDKEIVYLFKSLLNFLVNRYGTQVQNMTFELLYNGTNYYEYAQIYKNIEQILADYNVGKKLTGPGLFLDQDGLNLKEYFKAMLKNNIELQYLTLSITPYTFRKIDDKESISKVTDTNYILSQYNLVTEIMSNMNLNLKIYFTQWEEFQGKNNILNDSCYRGANIVRNIIECFNKVEGLSLITPLDLLSRISGNGIVEGLTGIICGKGMKKPAYYAYNFFNKTDKYYVTSDDNCFVSASGNRSFQIVCHNCKKLNYKYYTKSSKELSLDNMYEYYDDDEKLNITFKISNIPNSKYLIKTRTINKNIGSIQDEWKRMGYKDTSNVGPEEIKYLNSFSIPQIRAEVVSVNNNNLVYKCKLEPNEIKHIHIVYLH
ncbi:helix-turn-helix domain-containing protein [Clostridium sp. C2-6-12]|uniref:helix-turn-helix domain-containing protein n=1 Tax=Clostridium sp. C2-6-12 TaxID=2698832 RepID=UPI00136DE4A0|nr:helix-turn-helix domain-containing protein [Clostridium sp. C2-6-12]